MNDEWGTPEWAFELSKKIEPIYGFDAACNMGNCLIEEQGLFTDSLTLDWGSVVDYKTAIWCNPPYSRGNINKFIDKALYEAKENGVRSVFLVRFDPTAKWFQKAFKSGYCDIYMIPKRIKFKGADNTYPFPNCFIHFQAKDNKGGVYYI